MRKEYILEEASQTLSILCLFSVGSVFAPVKLILSTKNNPFLEKKTTAPESTQEIIINVSI